MSCSKLINSIYLFSIFSLASAVETDFGTIERWTLQLAPVQTTEAIPQYNGDQLPSLPVPPIQSNPQVPSNPQLPSTPDVPQLPNIPNTPQVPDNPAAPQIPDNIPSIDYGLCPVIQDSKNTTVFYDLILTLTQNDVYLTDEASHTLRTEMHNYLNAYGSCVCPSSRVYFDDVFRIESSDISMDSPIARTLLRRQTRRLVSKGRNRLATPGMYTPPPNVDFKRLVSDSIKKSTGPRRLNFQEDRQHHRHLEESPSCNYVNTSFAERLNETVAFRGIILNASVDENSMSTCHMDEDTCLSHISYNAPCEANQYDSSSLCQMSCCCSFPYSTRCRDLLKSKECDFNTFCNTGFPSEVFRPPVFKKKSVYFPGISDIVAYDVI